MSNKKEVAVIDFTKFDKALKELNLLLDATCDDNSFQKNKLKRIINLLKK